MPYFDKEVLSHYIRTDCLRQLRLKLSPEGKEFQGEREGQGMPPRQPPRPGMEQIAQAGEVWQAAKLDDLTRTFGAARVKGNAQLTASGGIRYEKQELLTALDGASASDFLVEAEFGIGPAFEAGLGIDDYRTRFGLGYGRVRPDLIHVLPPGAHPLGVRPDGETFRIPEGDARLLLRVIDIKLTAEPSPSYFAEVVLYSMALAGWLVDQGLDGEYVVAAGAAVWPGSHEASRIAALQADRVARGEQPTLGEIEAALGEDLELAPFEVFAFRLRQFFRQELPRVLETPWRELPWHVDNRCKGCDYLGGPWRDAEGRPTAHPDHCMPMALAMDHLSRVAFISRGARLALEGGGVRTVAELAGRTPADTVFEGHQALRAGRTVLAGRAGTLATGRATVPPESGTSSVMPRWSDLRVYLSVDFDLSSAITFAFGLKAFWLEPRAPDAPPLPPRRRQQWEQVQVVDQKSLPAEERELLAFLRQIHAILTFSRGASARTTVQFYLWDELQYDHLTRVIGRHLQAILNQQDLSYLAWLFPPEELLPNPRLIGRPSPITIVRDVVRAVVAAPVPHYYSLLELARAYQEPSLPPELAAFRVHPLYEDPLSDQVPSERAHDIWSRTTGPGAHWQDRLDTLRETVRRRLRALETITRRLEDDLRPILGADAPPINLGPPSQQNRLSWDGQL
jgi:hypothetical protein